MYNTEMRPIGSGIQSQCEHIVSHASHLSVTSNPNDMESTYSSY